MSTEQDRDSRFVLIAAGASGGHVYPGLATAEVLRGRGHRVEFAGGDRLETRVVPEAGFPFHPLKVPRPPSVRRELASLKGFRLAGVYVRAVREARELLHRLSPDVVLGMGGFAAVPVSLAAGRLGIPLVLHEQNAKLSLAQRLALRRASLLAMGLPLDVSVRRLRRAETLLVGNPVRSPLVRLATLGASDRREAKAAARRRLGLEPAGAVVLVMGGSLGSGPLNDDVPCAELPAGAQVLHLAGRGRAEPVKRAWGDRGRHAAVFEYLETMEDAYLAADVAVCRSGAITVAELAVAGLPSVLVPLETLRRGDQEANARILERAGAARVVRGSNADFLDVVSEELRRIVEDAGVREAMAAAASSQARPEAAERLAEAVLGRAGRRRVRRTYP